MDADGLGCDASFIGGREASLVASRGGYVMSGGDGDAIVGLLRFCSPYPVSANRRLTRSRTTGRFVLTKAYRESRRAIALAARGAVIGCFGRACVDECLARLMVRIHLVAHPPTRRPVDLDNLMKVTMDALTESGLVPDDSTRWVQSYAVSAGPVVKGGRLRIAVLWVGDCEHLEGA